MTVSVCQVEPSVLHPKTPSPSPSPSSSAGRMQDNEPLMRALSNLINLNQPDLVLFVGEALVGNDAGECRQWSEWVASVVGVAGVWGGGDEGGLYALLCPATAAALRQLPWHLRLPYPAVSAALRALLVVAAGCTA